MPRVAVQIRQSIFDGLTAQQLAALSDAMTKVVAGCISTAEPSGVEVLWFPYAFGYQSDDVCVDVGFSVGEDVPPPNVRKQLAGELLQLIQHARWLYDAGARDVAAWVLPHKDAIYRSGKSHPIRSTQ